jgi:hypothetical protein
MVLINGKPLPHGVSMKDWMRLHMSYDFYTWKNLLRGARGNYHYWSGV